MAFEKSRKVSIQWKLNPDVFSIINKDVLSDTYRRFGSSMVAVNAILAQEELLKATMPLIIGFNPNDLGWQKAVTTYWNDLGIDIPENGKELEIGFKFDVNDPSREKFISKLAAINKKDDEALANYCLSTLTKEREIELIRYGTPIKPIDYLLWVYSKNYRDVANTVEDINKSNYIRFYIHDNEVEKIRKTAAVNTQLVAIEKLTELIKSNDSSTRIYNLLCVLEPENIIELDSLNDNDRKVKIFELCQKDSEAFIKVVDDKTLDTRVVIEKLLYKKIIKRYNNTDIIVDSEDASLVLGNTTTEAISWFSMEQNAAKVSEYKTRLNG